MPAAENTYIYASKLTLFHHVKTNYTHPYKKYLC